MWLNELVVADPDELKTVARNGYFKNKQKRYSTTYHVNDKGEISLGKSPVDSFWSPSFSLRPQDKILALNNIEPTSKKFKDVVKSLQSYVPDIMSWSVDVTNLSHPASAKQGWLKSSEGKPFRAVRDRPVSYWFNQDDSDFSQKIPPFLYHGTSTELWYDGIKQKGLLPRLQADLGAAGSYGAGAALSRGNLVYLAVHPDAAARGAARQAASQHGGKPLVIKVNTQGLDFNKFTSDEDIEKYYNKLKDYRTQNNLRVPQPAQVSASSMGTVAYAGKVPPSLLSPMLIEKEFNNWVAFRDAPREEHPLTKKFNDAFAKGYSLSSYHSPYFYALVDAGLLKEKGYSLQFYPTRNVDDQEIRNLIKKSPWVKTAEAVAKNPPSLLNYAQVSPSKIVNLLLDSGFYTEKDGLIKFDDFNLINKSIKLAKSIHGLFTYDQLLKAMKDEL